MKENLLETIKDYKNRPNKDLEKVLELLNEDFEITKKNLIDLSKHLDKIELLYNTIYKEYVSRNK
jgi:hypothetical protein